MARRTERESERKDGYRVSLSNSNANCLKLQLKLMHDAVHLQAASLGEA